MNGEDLSDLMVHTVTVETLQGSTGWGQSWTGPSDEVPCFVDDQHRMVRDTSGTEQVSTATVYAPTQHAALFTPGSRVALASRTAEVIGVNTRTSGVLGLPDHVEVTLT